MKPDRGRNPTAGTHLLDDDRRQVGFSRQGVILLLLLAAAAAVCIGMLVTLNTLGSVSVDVANHLHHSVIA